MWLLSIKQFLCVCNGRGIVLHVLTSWDPGLRGTLIIVLEVSHHQGERLWRGLLKVTQICRHGLLRAVRGLGSGADRWGTRWAYYSPNVRKEATRWCVRLDLSGRLHQRGHCLIHHQQLLRWFTDQRSHGPFLSICYSLSIALIKPHRLCLIHHLLAGR